MFFKILCSFGLLGLISYTFHGLEPSTLYRTSNKVSHSLTKELINTPDPNLLWKQAMNSNKGELHKLYIENAYKVTPEGKLILGAEAIQEHYLKETGHIDRIAAKNRITSVHDSAIQYEIGRFSAADKKSYAHLIIWRAVKGKLKRELEIISSINAPEAASALKELSKRRNEWMRLCNLHSAANLVKELYTENTLYYNHKPMIMGRDAVIQEYQYMNRPTYKLQLTPIHIQLARQNLAFEIGQCSGSYGGNYVLIWKKDKEGVWRILLDSNI